jgi:hypothetical protein
MPEFPTSIAVAKAMFDPGETGNQDLLIFFLLPFAIYMVTISIGQD